MSIPKARLKLQNIYDIIGTRSVQLQKKLVKCGINTTFVAQSGIDADIILSDISFRDKWENRGNEGLKIVYAGGITTDKNVGTIIKALGILRAKVRFSFTVIGEGNCKADCIRTAEKNEIIDACHFLGRLTRAETISQMREADVFIMVSQRETLGLVYLEAMSQGCITIGSRDEGIDGILLNEKNGYLVQSGNEKELAARILAIAESSLEEKMRVAYAGIETIRQMTSEKTAEDYLKSVL
ncbi:MAG: glycosyltransferase family 4 protein [Eubacteriales bacterium]|nr:glycosyltransferase family 4 protein [Eubacteriales bacterium]